jgi:hypothetical protein
MRLSKKRRTMAKPVSPGLPAPVSAARVELRPMTGEAEALLAEGRPNDPGLALKLLEMLGVADPPFPWSALSVHDVDTLIVQLRRANVADRVVAEARCGGANCGEPIELSLRLGDWLAHHRPRPVGARHWAVEPAADAPGWLRIVVNGVEEAQFRLPLLSDQIAAAGAPDPARAMAARCLRPEGLPARARRRTEAAMEAMAPPLTGEVSGRCPTCGAAIEAWFDARLYCMQDLCARARYVFDDVDVLAERYHWSERAILRLPRARRERYAERARLARAA